MTAWLARWRARLAAVLSGVRFQRALARNQRAVEALDRAVREVMER